MCVKMTSLFDSEIKVYYVTILKCFKSNTSTPSGLTTYSNLETWNGIYCKAILVRWSR